MRINEVSFDDSQPIDGYGPGFFRIGGVRIDGSVVLLPSGPQSWAGYDDLEPLIAAAGEIDVLFIGTGSMIAHPPAEMRQAMEAAGLGIEAMATPPACRTYNVLLAEGRRVGAALLPVEAGGAAPHAP